MKRAQELAEGADLMLCVGSSLAVYPVAGLPRVTIECGGRLAIVTKGPTPYDRAAELKLEGEVDEELDALLARSSLLSLRGSARIAVAQRTPCALHSATIVSSGSLRTCAAWAHFASASAPQPLIISAPTMPATGTLMQP